MKNTKQFTLVLVSKLKGLCNLMLTASSTFKHPAFFLNLLQSLVSPHIVSEVDYLSSTTVVALLICYLSMGEDAMTLNISAPQHIKIVICMNLIYEKCLIICKVCWHRETCSHGLE